MASIDKKRPDGKYRARWRETPNGPQKNRLFDRKIDAQRWLDKVSVELAEGTYIDPSVGRQTFMDYAEAWRKLQVHRGGTASQIEANLRNHVYPRLGARPIRDIRRSEILGLVKELDAKLAPATVTLIYRWVVSVFRSAIADRIIAESPCREINLPNVDQTKVVPLSVETVEALIDAVPDRYRALILLGAGTGVRISEAVGVTTDRVDWMKGRSVTIDRQLLRDGGATPVWGPVKDRKNRPRTIPLSPTVLAGMVEHVRVYGTGPGGLLFTNASGRPVRRTGFSEMWQKAARPLGIPTGDGFHQLRHFYASLLIHHGESVKVVQDRLGHASSKETLDTYGHLWPNSEESTRDAVEAVLGRDRARTSESGR